MANLKQSLTRLNDNLNTLQEREAKFGSNSPLELVNRIHDHKQAIALTQQAITGKLTEAEWREAMEPLLVSINREQTVVNLQLEQIHAEQGAAVATGQGARAGVFNINIRDIRRLPVVVVLLGVVMLAAVFLSARVNS